jgi:hypothetical protein
LQCARSISAGFARRIGGSQGISAIISENAPKKAQTAPLPQILVRG